MPARADHTQHKRKRPHAKNHEGDGCDPQGDELRCARGREDPNAEHHTRREEEDSCENCKTERLRRQKVLTGMTTMPVSLQKPPFSSAPALYSFNVPRYFCTNVRAREFCKQSNVQLSWCYAKDIPLHPGDRELKAEALQNKLLAWLRRHDQETSHLPSIYPLAVGMPIRLTENVDRNRQL